MQHLLMFRDSSLRQSPQQAQYLLSVTQRPASQLTYNERVAEHLFLIKQ